VKIKAELHNDSNSSESVTMARKLVATDII
jgi:hypothetical protein